MKNKDLVIIAIYDLHVYDILANGNIYKRGDFEKTICDEADGVFSPSFSLSYRNCPNFDKWIKEKFKGKTVYVVEDGEIRKIGEQNERT